MKKVKSRNGLSGGKGTSGSLVVARSSVKQIQEQKRAEAIRLKQELNLALEKRKQKEYKSQERQQYAHDTIKMMENNLRAVIEGMEEHRIATVKLMKASQLQEEMNLIQNMDQEAKYLERKEKQLTKRVKETYKLQKVALG